MASAPHRRLSDQQHRRETLLYIILPMMCGGVIVALGVVAVVLLPRRLQVSIIADWMSSVFLLCPLVLCLFAVCMILMVAVAGMNKLHQQAAKPLNRLEDLSQNLADKAVSATDSINQKTVGWSSKFAFLDRLLGIFDEPSRPVEPEREDKNG